MEFLQEEGLMHLVCIVGALLFSIVAEIIRRIRGE